MAGNAQKTPFARTLNQFAERKVLGAIQQLGAGLPAKVAAVSGSIVTVSFSLTNVPYTLPNVTCTLAGSIYARAPTQVGDLGVVLSADAYIGSVTGLGGGSGDMTLRANLSSLIFFPVGNKNWPASDDPNAYVIYGPDGVILRDSAKKNIFTLTPSEVTLQMTDGSCVITVPAGQTFTLNGNGIVNGNWQINGGLALEGNITAADGISPYAGDIKTTGDVIAKVGASQVGLSTHAHTQPNDSHGDTEQPTASPTPGT